MVLRSRKLCGIPAPSRRGWIMALFPVGPGGARAREMACGCQFRPLNRPVPRDVQGTKLKRETLFRVIVRIGY